MDNAAAENTVRLLFAALRLGLGLYGSGSGEPGDVPGGAAPAVSADAVPDGSTAAEPGVPAGAASVNSVAEHGAGLGSEVSAHPTARPGGTEPARATAAGSGGAASANMAAGSCSAVSAGGDTRLLSSGSEPELREVFLVADRHKLGHIVALAYEKAGLFCPRGNPGMSGEFGPGAQEEPGSGAQEELGSGAPGEPGSRAQGEPGSGAPSELNSGASGEPGDRPAAAARTGTGSPEAPAGVDWAPGFAEVMERSIARARAEYERRKITSTMCYAALDEAGIPYLPLKGETTAVFYPEEWLRPSCDIDILVPRDRHREAVKLFRKKLGGKKSEISTHDVGFLMPSKVNVELHHSFLSLLLGSKTDCTVKTVLNGVSPVSPGAMRQQLSADALILIHLSHMAEHLRAGGCGLRSFVDLIFLRRGLFGLDNGFPEECRGLLREAELEQFAESAFTLADAILTNSSLCIEDHDFLHLTLRGGVYGSMEIQVVFGEAARGGEFLITRLFPPIHFMRGMFPILNKFPFLLPFTWIARWVIRFVTGGLRRSAKGVVRSRRLSSADLARVRAMREHLGI